MWGEEMENWNMQADSLEPFSGLVERDGRVENEHFDDLMGCFTDAYHDGLKHIESEGDVEAIRAWNRMLRPESTT